MLVINKYPTISNIINPNTTSGKVFPILFLNFLDIRLNKLSIEQKIKLPIVAIILRTNNIASPNPFKTI